MLIAFVLILFFVFLLYFFVFAAKKDAEGSDLGEHNGA
jgi:hypothetical protein